MATGPWFESFAKWCQRNPGHDVGLCVALTNPYDELKWRLISGRSLVPSLVNAEGFPWRTPMQLVSNASAAEVEQELHSQIIRARAAGVQLSHLSGYYGTIFARYDLAAVLVNAARKHWLPAGVVELRPDQVERFRREGLSHQRRDGSAGADLSTSQTG